VADYCRQGLLILREKFITSFGMVEVAHLFLYFYYWDRAINRTKGNAVIDAFILKKVIYSFSEKE
jgi:hypothetical protein